MKTNKEIDEAVIEALKEFKQGKTYSNTFIRMHCSMNDIKISNSDIRSSLHRIRTKKLITNVIIADNKGYKIAENTQEVKKYLKSLHKRALKIHKLFGAVKEQAELIMGAQFEFDFYSDIYNTEKK